MRLFVLLLMIVSFTYFSQFHYMIIFLCVVNMLKDWSLDWTDTACKTQIKQFYMICVIWCHMISYDVCHMCHFYMILQTTLKYSGHCPVLTYKVVYSVCMSKNSIHVILKMNLRSSHLHQALSPISAIKLILA